MVNLRMPFDDSDYDFDSPHAAPAKPRPVAGVTPRVTSGFDDSRDGGKRKHRATDYAFGEGDPLSVNRGGRVRKIGEDGLAGKHLFIDHGDGHESSYSHLSSIDVEEGDEIEPGVIFGRAGSTGKGTGPHVHQVVRRAGARVRAEETGIKPIRGERPFERRTGQDYDFDSTAYDFDNSPATTSQSAQPGVDSAQSSGSPSTPKPTSNANPAGAAPTGLPRGSRPTSPEDFVRGTPQSFQSYVSTGELHAPAEERDPTDFVRPAQAPSIDEPLVEESAPRPAPRPPGAPRAQDAPAPREAVTSRVLDGDEEEEALRHTALPANPDTMGAARDFSAGSFEAGVYKVSVGREDTPDTLSRRFLEQAADAASLPADLREQFVRHALAEGHARFTDAEGIPFEQRLDEAERAGSLPVTASPELADALRSYQRLADERARGEFAEEIERARVDALLAAQRAGRPGEDAARAGELAAEAKEAELAAQGGGTLRGEGERRARVETLKSRALTDPFAAAEFAGRLGAEAARGAGDVIASGARGMSVLAEAGLEPVVPLHFVGRMLGDAAGYLYAKSTGRTFTPSSASAPADSQLAYRMADQFEEALGQDKDLAPEFVAKVARGAGSSVPFFLLGAATGGSAWAAGALGAVSQAGSAYKELTEKGATGGARLLGSLASMPVGASEMFGVGSTVNRVTGGLFLRSFARWLKDTGREATEEALQEFFQTAAGESIVQLASDRDPTVGGRLRNLYARSGEIVGKAADASKVALVVGGVAGAGTSAARQALGGGEEVSPVGDIPTNNIPASSTPAPSTPEALPAQIDALKAGRRAVVQIPPGEKVIVPSGMRSFKDFDGGRIIYNPDQVSRDEVVRRMDDGTLAEFARRATGVSLDGQGEEGETVGGRAVPERGADDVRGEDPEAGRAAETGLVPVAAPVETRLPGAGAPRAAGADDGAEGSLTLTGADVRARFTENGEFNINRASDELAREAKEAINAGKGVTLVVDGKRVPIVEVTGGALTDAKGQRWGLMTLFTGKDENNALRIAGAPVDQASPTPERISDTRADSGAHDEVRRAVEEADPEAEPTFRQFPEGMGASRVPRAAMPQIKSEHRGAMVQFLKGRGITHTQEQVAPDTLKPSQADWSPEKVKKALGFEGPDRSILVSSDDHVADGHHQWLSKLHGKDGRTIPVIRLNAPIDRLLLEMARFPSSGVDEASAGVTPRGEEKSSPVKGEEKALPPSGSDTRKRDTAVVTEQGLGEQPSVAETAASVKTETISKKTGLTPTQTRFLAAELRDVRDELPAEANVEGGYDSKRLKEGEPTHTIDVPGDGSFTLHSQKGVDNLHKKLTGKTAGQFEEAQKEPAGSAAPARARVTYPERRSQKYYYSDAGPEGEYVGRYEEVPDALPATVKGHEDLDLFLRDKYRGEDVRAADAYVVTEGMTGARIAEGRTPKAAIAAAKKYLDENAHRVQGGIDGHVKKHGPTPRYKSSAAESGAESLAIAKLEGADSSATSARNLIPRDEAEYREVLARLKSKLAASQLRGSYYGLDVIAGLMPDLVRAGAYLVRNGLRAVSDWSARMAEDFGEPIRPYLRKIYAEALELAEPANPSPIRWVGGKAQFLPVIQRLFEPFRDLRLVEPFFGSGTVSMGLRPRRALVNDFNPVLANFHRRVAAGMVYDLPYEAGAGDFARARARYNELLLAGETDTAEAAKLFFYLNQTAHGGLYRVNGRGEFNAPFQADRAGKPIRDLTPYRERYKGIRVTSGDFEKMKVGEGDFIYSDPPYDSEFSAYQKGGFGWGDQVRHAEWLARQAVPVVTQNEATPRILELYKSLGFDVWEIPARRSISRDGANRGAGSATEMIATRNIPFDHVERSLEGTDAQPYARADGEAGEVPVSRERAEYNAVKARVVGRLNSANLRGSFFGIDVVAELLPDLARMGAYHLRNGAHSLAEFSARMVEDLGEGIRPHLEKIYAEAKKLVEGEYEHDADIDRGAGTFRPAGDTPGRLKAEDVDTEAFASQDGAADTPLRSTASLGTAAPSEDAAASGDDKKGDAEYVARDGKTHERSFPKTLEAAGLEAGDDRTYEVFTNKQALEEADEIIRDKGLDGAAEYLRAADDWGPEHTALAYRLLSQTDGQRAVDVASTAARALTRQGQAIQAAQLVSRLAPERVAVVASRVAQAAGTELTPEHLANIKKLAARALEQEERADSLASKLANAQATIRRLRDESPAKKKESPGVTARRMTTRLISRLEKMESEARVRMNERKALMVAAPSDRERGSSIIPADIADIAIIGAAKMARGALKHSVWLNDMLAEFGEGVRDSLPAVRKQAARLYREEKKKLRREALAHSVTGGRPEGFTDAEVDELIEARRLRLRERARAEKEIAREAGEVAAPRPKLDPKQGPRLSEAPRQGPRLTEAPAQGPKLSEGLKAGPPAPGALAREVMEATAGADEMVRAGALLIADRGDLTPGQYFDEMKARFGVNERHVARTFREAYAAVKAARKNLSDRAAERAVTGGNPAALPREEVRRLVEEREAARESAAEARRELAQAFEALDPPEPLDRALGILADVWNVSRNTKSTLDLSAIGRQGYLGALSDFEAGRAGAGAKFKALTTEGFERVVEAIRKDSHYRLGKKSGLYLATREHGRGGTAASLRRLARREEAFMSTLPSRLAAKPLREMHPVAAVVAAPFKPLAHAMAASERSYVGTLDTLRQSMFSHLADEILADKDLNEGQQRKALEYAAKRVNHLTGRGTFGKNDSLGGIAAFVNGTFFAPRFMWSRFQTLSPLQSARAPKGARLITGKKVGRVLVLHGLALAALALAGFDVEWDDPEDPDWMKARLRGTDHVYDIGAGLQQPARAILRSAARAVKGMRGKLKGGEANYASIWGDFFERKLHPSASYAHGAFTGKTLEYDDVTGKKKDFEYLGHVWDERGRLNPGGGLVDLAAPLFFKDAWESYQKHGASGVAAVAPAFFGAGYQDYPERERAEMSEGARRVFEEHGKEAYVAPSKLSVAGRDRELKQDERAGLERDVRAETTRRVEQFFAPTDEAGRARLDHYQTATKDEQRKTLDGLQRDAAEEVRAKFKRAYQEAHKAEITNEREGKKSAERARRGELIERKKSRGVITPEEAGRALERLGRGNQNTSQR